MTCSLCDKPVVSRGWCHMHYVRWRRHGDPNVRYPLRTADPTYTTVHSRLKAIRGKASSYLCVDCGRQAQDWAYSKGGGEGGLPFSTDLNEYEPRCKMCHKKLDKPQPLERPCSIDGCDAPHEARGMCRKHYHRWYRKQRVADRNTSPQKEETK